MKSHRLLLVVVAVVGMFAPISMATAESGPSEGVPDLPDPASLSAFVPVGVGRVADDPDFPFLLLANQAEGLPQFILVILDRQNGKETWSGRKDAPVFLVLFADPSTIQQPFLDDGFAEIGKASGRFVAMGPESLEELVAKFRKGYLRSKASVRGPNI